MLAVDDMFVVAASWNYISEQQNKLPLSERIGLMLQHAGVSITVTSLTDFMAFLVGSFTVSTEKLFYKSTQSYSIF